MHKDCIMPVIGSHVEATRAKLAKTVENVELPVVQFYTGGRSTFQRSPIKDDLGRRLFEAGYKTEMFIHGCLNINLARDPSESPKGFRSLLTDIDNAKKIGGCLVVHIGSHLNEFSVDSVTDNLGKMSFESDHHPQYKPLLLENCSGNKGKGTKIGSTWDELEALSQRKPERVGFCIDTQHSFAAGLSKFDSVDEINEFFKKLDNKIGIENVKLFHLNDSEITFDGKVDRHAQIFPSKSKFSIDLSFLPINTTVEISNSSGGNIWDSMQEDRKSDAFKHLLLKCGELKIPLITETRNKNDASMCYEFLSK